LSCSLSPNRSDLLGLGLVALALALRGLVKWKHAGISVGDQAVCPQPLVYTKAKGCAMLYLFKGGVPSGDNFYISCSETFPCGGTKIQTRTSLGGERGER